MLPLDRPLLDQITLAAAGVAAVALLLGVVAQVRIARLRRLLAVVDAPDGRQSVLEVVGRSREETAQLRSEVEATKRDIADTRTALSDALRHVAVVRYDAFGDMGGRLSFTAALLDDAGDGLIITSIHGRSEARTYAKGVTGGSSEQSLSPEEQQAIDAALRGPARG
ncbi:MAG TPA: DUF4446 family protein [Mycobacteriales bacterium]|nr:DUF4446 family protein [Mycobacteriales bacterium]